MIEPLLPPPIVTRNVNEIEATYEKTFLNQVKNLGSVRERRPPARFDDECNYTESLLDDVEEPKSFNAAHNSKNFDQWEKAMKNEFKIIHGN